MASPNFEVGNIEMYPITRGEIVIRQLANCHDDEVRINYRDVPLIIEALSVFKTWCEAEDARTLTEYFSDTAKINE